MAGFKQVIHEIHRRSLWQVLACLLVLSCVGCEFGPAPLTAAMPLHLEEHLDAATIEGSEVPEDLPEAVEWRFDEPQPDWKSVVPLNRAREALRVARTDDALRVMLTEGTGIGIRSLFGGIYVELPDWRWEDWAYVLVHARTSEDIERLTVGVVCNLNQDPEQADPRN